MKNIAKQNGFSLIAIMIAILIIAVIFFGIKNWKGNTEQTQEIKNKAVEDLGNINKNLENNNQEMQDALTN